MTKKEQCMELARLMREGSKTTEQLRGAYFARSNDQTIFTCAIGAILYAKGMIGRGGGWKALCDIYPILIDQQEKPNLMYSIEIKNESLGWKREQIADWLETLEWSND